MTQSRSTLKNKRICLLARDPGSANMLFPLVLPLRQMDAEVFVFGKDFAIQQFENQGVHAEDIRKWISLNRFSTVAHWFSRFSPDALITGLSDDLVERFFWKQAEVCGVPSLAILDSWFNLKIRFSRFLVSESVLFQKYGTIAFLPESIICLDEKAKSNLVAEGLPCGRVYPLGNPFFDYLIRGKKYIRCEENRKKMREKHGIKEEDLAVLFFSDPLTEVYPDVLERFHYTEKTILESFLRVIGGYFSPPPLVIIRPHPRESHDKFRGIPIPDQLKARVRIDGFSLSEEHLALADIAFGMNSMMMIQSSLYGIPTWSLQFGRKEPLAFETMGFFKPLLSSEAFVTFVKNKKWLAETPSALSIRSGATDAIIRFLASRMKSINTPEQTRE